MELEDTCLNNTCQKEVSREIEKCFELKENTIYQKLWEAAKAMFREKFITLKTYIRKEERSKISNINFHFKKLKKKGQFKPKASRRK